MSNNALGGLADELLDELSGDLTPEQEAELEKQWDLSHMLADLVKIQSENGTIFRLQPITILRQLVRLGNLLNQKWQAELSKHPEKKGIELLDAVSGFNKLEVAKELNKNFALPDEVLVALFHRKPSRYDDARDFSANPINVGSIEAAIQQIEAREEAEEVSPEVKQRQKGFLERFRNFFS